MCVWRYCCGQLRLVRVVVIWQWCEFCFVVHFVFTVSYWLNFSVKMIRLKVWRVEETLSDSLNKPFLQSRIVFLISISPLTSSWPHLRYDVGLEEGEYKWKLSLCYSIVYYYNGAQRYEQFLHVGWLYRALILLGLALCLPSASVSSVLITIETEDTDTKIFFCLHPSLYLLVSWAYWDWPLTWLTNHRPSVLWHCWLGHVTRKPVSKMTYNVSSGTLNSTVPFLFPFRFGLMALVLQDFCLVLLFNTVHKLYGTGILCKTTDCLDSSVDWPVPQKYHVISVIFRWIWLNVVFLSSFIVLSLLCSMSCSVASHVSVVEIS